MAVHFGTLDFKTPLIFADGTSVYEKFAKESISHKKGFFILAPSGSGKTYFIEHQREKHWIDGDSLWEAANAHPKGRWWLWGDLIDEIDSRSDSITREVKKLGFWIIGASNNWLKPDAIVLPHWSTHKRYIKERELANYDSGATSDRLSQVLGHRKWIRQWIKKRVPCFDSVQRAADFLANSYFASLNSDKST